MKITGFSVLSSFKLLYAFNIILVLLPLTIQFSYYIYHSFFFKEIFLFSLVLHPPLLIPPRMTVKWNMWVMRFHLLYYITLKNLAYLCQCTVPYNFEFYMTVIVGPRHFWYIWGQAKLIGCNMVIYRHIKFLRYFLQHSS